MHRAIANAVRPGTFNPRPALRVKLTALPVGHAQVIADRGVWRRGADLFTISGEPGDHDCISAASVLAGDGNPLPETSNQ